MQIRISGVVEESIVDGPGIRYVIFAQGCKHQCQGCHNPQTHDFNGGECVSIDWIVDSIKINPLIKGVTLSGGDPFEQAANFAELAKRLKRAGYHVMTYTGYTFEEIERQKQTRMGWSELIQHTDWLVDGRYDLNQRGLDLKFRGSKNQRIIDVPKTYGENHVVEVQL